MRREDRLACGCTVEARVREQHVYGETTEQWCTGHGTWHGAEHHAFSGEEEVCDTCGNAARWHVNSE